MAVKDGHSAQRSTNDGGHNTDHEAGAPADTTHQHGGGDGSQHRGYLLEADGKGGEYLLLGKRQPYQRGGGDNQRVCAHHQRLIHRQQGHVSPHPIH